MPNTSEYLSKLDFLCSDIYFPPQFCTHRPKWYCQDIKRVFLFLLHAPKTSQEKPLETPSFKRRIAGVDPQEEAETGGQQWEERAEGWMQLKIGLTKHL